MSKPKEKELVSRIRLVVNYNLRVFRELSDNYPDNTKFGEKIKGIIKSCE